MKKMKNSVLLILLLLLMCGGNKVFAIHDETAVNQDCDHMILRYDGAMPVRDYRVDTIDGSKMVTLFGRCVGEEKVIQVEFLRSVAKNSLHFYKALCDNDTVALLDLNPEVGGVFSVGSCSAIKVRPITRLRLLYWELPSAPAAYCFEKDTVWFSRDDVSPKYVLIDEGVRIK